MGKLPIISRRGTRDNEFVSAACSVGCGARAGTACGCAAATAGTSVCTSSVCTSVCTSSPFAGSTLARSTLPRGTLAGSTLASSTRTDFATAPRSTDHQRKDSKLRASGENALLAKGRVVPETVEVFSRRYRRPSKRGRDGETCELGLRCRRSRRGAVRDAEGSSSVTGGVDQQEKRERVAAGSERLFTAAPRTGARVGSEGLQGEVTDIDSGSAVVFRSTEKRTKGLGCTTIRRRVDSARRGLIEAKTCALPCTTVAGSVNVTVEVSKGLQEPQCKVDLADRTDSTVSHREDSAVTINTTDADIVTAVPQEARRHRDHPRFTSSLCGIRATLTYRGAVLRALLLGLFVMSLMCDPIHGVPADRSRLGLFEDPFEQDDLAAIRNTLDENELEIIRRGILQALGLQRIPDLSKANVSQAEYERAHREYLKKVQLAHNGSEPRKRRSLHIFHATDHPGNRSSSVDANEVGRHVLFFPVEIPNEDGAVDHAALRLLLEGHHRHYGEVEVLVYLATDESRRLIDRHRIRFDDPRDTRWIELDSTEAASSWHDHGDSNLGVELEFLHDGVPVSRTFSSPTLNVFTTSHDENGFVGRRRRAALDPLRPLHVGRRTECRGDKKCCRHEMTVIFKDLKGFDFIVQPKFFDAGYCKGRCPPRYNPAHHHALLQSLIWKEDRSKAPRPCCAPSKLTEVEIVYYDENNPDKLKVSNWKNMRVEECACS